MNVRACVTLFAFLLCLAAGLPAQSRFLPVEEVRPGMTGIGRTVFEGDRLDEFKVHVLGVLHNVIGPRRDLILARLEGGPLANAGVIAGMSGSPVYIDGRLVGAVSYSLGEFSKEPIAGITPIAEMIADATLATPRRQLARMDVPAALTPESLQASLRQAFSWSRPFAQSPSDVQAFGNVTAGLGTLLRPIATPLTFGGFDPTVLGSVTSVFHDQGFIPMLAGSAQTPRTATAAAPRLRPGDPLGVALMSGDLEIGATGTVTDVDGDKVYAFGHPFYGLGPTQFPLTRAYVLTVLPSLQASQKIASTGEVIGTISQDRATTIAGTLGKGPAMIPLRLTLKNEERGFTRTFNISLVNDELFTPILAYTSIVTTLQSYERQNGVGTYVLRGSANIKNHGAISFEDLFTGDQPSTGAASSVVAPINFLLRNSFEDVEFEGLTLEVDASEQPRSATLERAWVDGTRVKAGTTVDLKVLLRTYRGEEITKSVPVRIPANASGSVSIMVADAARLSQWEARELQVQPAQTRGVSQMIRLLNDAKKNNRLYVRMVTRDGGAVVRGESLAALPPSVLAVMESDRNGGSFRPLQSALMGEWEIVTGHAVTGSRTLTLPLDE
ncbi:MAG TPA: SpoIVB peptidase S55 domain-containing protein [Vicinamibacterales bacterium]|nr:SpoIVB peptidase S55 domain-containing protein [Vicinamibacterales bacterium]